MGSAVEVSAWTDSTRFGAVHDNQLGGGQRSIEIARLASSVTNEQTFVEGTESPWWASITPKRRQELRLVELLSASSSQLPQCRVGVRAFRLRRQRWPLHSR